MAISHVFVSTKADGADTTLVRPSDWNAPHKFDEVVSLGGYVVLTNVGTAYDTIAAARGLGIALVDFTGVNEILFRVFVNKIGVGTQSWQLFNVTDGLEIGVIDDAGATGNKVLSATFTTGIPTGIKLVRVRVKSTDGADDPVYYGGALLLRKTS